MLVGINGHFFYSVPNYLHEKTQAGITVMRADCILSLSPVSSSAFEIKLPAVGEEREEGRGGKQKGE